MVAEEELSIHSRNACFWQENAAGAFTIRATSGLIMGSFNPEDLISDMDSLSEQYASVVPKLHLVCCIPARVSSNVLMAFAC